MRYWLALFLWIPAVLWGQPPASLPQTWQHVAKLSSEDTIMVVQTEGRVVEGRFQSISSESLVLDNKNQVRSLPLPSIEKVSVKRKASRAKSAAIGFGVCFSIGAAAAGHLTDRNNPKLTTRAGMGADVGLLGAGIAAGVGALAGGSRFETVYRHR
jgi:hypothetical protein